MPQELYLVIIKHLLNKDFRRKSCVELYLLGVQ